MGPETPLLRAVLDTNVVVSALLFEGPVNRLADLWRRGDFRLLVSADVVREYTRVLAYPKFHRDEDDVLAMVHEDILPFADLAEVADVPRVVKEDPSDDLFLACAVEGQADALVSGDDHLLRLKKHRGIAILPPKAFLARYFPHK